MNRQLWLGINILGGPIVREIDGLAMSSRNAYLDGRERELSLCLSQALCFAKQRYQASVGAKEQLSPEGLRREIEAQIPTELEEVEVDYVEVVDPTTLLPATNLDSETRVILAVKIGKTRLIDNANLSFGHTKRRQLLETVVYTQADDVRASLVFPIADNGPAIPWGTSRGGLLY